MDNNDTFKISADSEVIAIENLVENREKIFLDGSERGRKTQRMFDLLTGGINKAEEKAKRIKNVVDNRLKGE